MRRALLAIVVASAAAAVGFACGGDFNSNDTTSDGGAEAGTPPPPTPDPPADAGVDQDNDAGTRIIFLTTKTYHPGLAGLDFRYMSADGGADDVCNAEAASATNTRIRASRFTAWMSDFSDGGAARDRITRSPGAFITTRGELIATNFDDLVSGSIRAPIKRDVDGVDVTVQTKDVWTGTDQAGRPLDQDCVDWTASGGELGAVGDATATDGTWSGTANPIECRSLAHLYCVEN
jgi:hypothetical protein